MTTQFELKMEFYRDFFDNSDASFVDVLLKNLRRNEFAGPRYVGGVEGN